MTGDIRFPYQLNNAFVVSLEASRIPKVPDSPQLEFTVQLKVIDEQPEADLKLEDVKEEIENNAALRKSHMDADFKAKLAERGKEAEIKVFLPEHEAVIEEFKNPPEPMAMPPGMGMPGPAPKPPAEDKSESDAKPAEKE